MGDFSFLRFESFVDGYRLAVTWGQLIWEENQGDGPQCYRDFFRLFDKHFGEQKSDEYYVQLLEVYRGVGKQADFVIP
jgi:hypothetical protein